MIPATLSLDIVERPKKPTGPVSRIQADEVVEVTRLSTGLENVDRVFGDAESPGLAVGSVVQLGGAPGAGKSTLLAQIAASMPDDVLYVTTEESRQRLAGRVIRVVGREAKLFDAVSTIDARLGIGGVCEVIRQSSARVVIVDSLQGLRIDPPPDDGRSGGTPQVKTKHSQTVVRDNALLLINEANRPPKRSIFVTCHLTKDDSLAGLREIEHMVDIVAWFRGNPKRPRRELSCSKNRDGETGTTAVFKMTKRGLVEVSEEEDKQDQADRARETAERSTFEKRGDAPRRRRVD